MKVYPHREIVFAILSVAFQREDDYLFGLVIHFSLLRQALALTVLPNESISSSLSFSKKHKEIC